MTENRKIVSYKILSAKFTDDLEDEVNDYIDKGFNVHGNLVATQYNIHQVMVLYADD